MAGRAVVPVVGDHDVHLVVAVGEQLVQDPSVLRVHGREPFGLHGPADAQPPELATVPPVVHLGR